MILYSTACFACCLNGLLMLSKGKKLAQMGAPKILPNLFDDGAVGLRIVAAMSADCIDSGQKPIKEKAKSDPIPIRARGAAVAAGHPAAKMKAEVVEAEDGDGDVELSESYTCVISRVEGGAVRKRVYLDDGVVVDGICGKFEMNSGVFFESPTTTVGPIPGDFLSCCYLCRKKLHGLDIFMYRGDKAFCSAECRYQQILSDEHKEKCRSEARESRNSPLSPYLTPLSYDAGVAAA